MRGHHGGASGGALADEAVVLQTDGIGSDGVALVMTSVVLGIAARQLVVRYGLCP